MTKLHFCGYEKANGAVLAHVKTANMGIPMVVMADNYETYPELSPQVCQMDICGIGYHIKVFRDAEAFANTGTMMSEISMIPVGLFHNKEQEDLGPGPVVAFSGIVEKVDRLIEDPENPSASEIADEANDIEPDLTHVVVVKSLDFSMRCAVSWQGEIEPGNIVTGLAGLFGNIEPVTEGQQHTADKVQ